MVKKHVRRGSRLHADEHFSYDDLEGLQELHRVNHSEEYQTERGVNTNHVESSFSRVQRAYVGIHHRFSVRYFDWYAAEIAWREDNRNRKVTKTCRAEQPLAEAESLWNVPSGLVAVAT